ncbi:MAG: hypothetical protein M3478_08540 [Planctomycetota bacterium]|nr:hypothetical protein [Planctomycetota bacterium]
MFRSRITESDGSGNGNGHANGKSTDAASYAGGAVAAPAAPSGVKAEIHRRLIETMDLAQARRMPREELHRECSKRIDQLLSEQRTPLSMPERQRVL